MEMISVEKLLDKSQNSIYKLVVMAAKRALEIADGQSKLIDIPASVKPSTVALYEIMAGKIGIKK